MLSALALSLIGKNAMFLSSIFAGSNTKHASSAGTWKQSVHQTFEKFIIKRNIPQLVKVRQDAHLPQRGHMACCQLLHNCRPIKNAIWKELNRWMTFKFTQAHWNCHYSQTSLYQIRLIQTSCYIELGLWCQSQAIIKGRKNIVFIERGYIEVSAISSMQHCPNVSLTVVCIEQCPKSPVVICKVG